MGGQRVEGEGESPDTNEASRMRGDFVPLLRAAFERSPVSVMLFDRDGHPVAVNGSFEQLWGVGLADLPPDYSILRDTQLEAAGVMPVVFSAFGGETVTTPPLRYVMSGANGRETVLWVQAHLHPVRNERGEMERIVLSHEDVTARLEYEEAMARTVARAERLQVLTTALSTAATTGEVAEAVIKHAGDVFSASGVVIARPSDDGLSLVIMKTASTPATVTPEWQTSPIAEHSPLADVARTMEPLYLESRAEWLHHYPTMAPLLDLGGYHATAVAPLVVNGRMIGVIGVAFDSSRHFHEVDRALLVTIAQQCAQALERARLFESERVARHEAEAANRAKGEFLAAMSHELRTPLNAIAGHVELLDMGIYGPVTPEQRSALRRIERAQQYLLRHVNDVLNFARLRAGRTEFELQPVRIADLVADLEPMLLPQLRDKSLTYRAEVDPELRAMADRDKLMQVLLNLLSNAAKFTPPGGQIALERARRADLSEDPRTIFLRVVDTGVGIPPDRCDAVFEPFVQVDTSPARRRAGSGLGLAISRDLVRGMGGELRVRSKPGVGTSFTVTLKGADLV